MKLFTLLPIAISLSFTAFAQSVVLEGVVNSPSEAPWRTVYVRDTFQCSLASVGTTGCLGWYQPNPGTVFLPSATPGQPGGITLDTSGTINSTAAIVLQAALTQDASEFFFQRWNIVSIGGTNPASDDNVRIGLFNSVSVLAPPTGGMYLEHCSSATMGCAGADTDWFCVANTGGTSTRTDTGVAFGTGTTALQIWRIDSTHISCKVATGSRPLSGLLGATAVTVSGGEPAGALVAGAVAVNTAAESKQITINWFDQSITALNR